VQEKIGQEKKKGEREGMGLNRKIVFISAPPLPLKLLLLWTSSYFMHGFIHASDVILWLIIFVQPVVTQVPRF
jgi:hypothetical protein